MSNIKKMAEMISVAKTRNKSDEVVNHDMVNQPPHYKSAGVTKLGIEVINVIEAVYSENYHLGNAVKYLLRAPYKGKMEEDLRKCVWYIERFLSVQDVVKR